MHSFFNRICHTPNKVKTKFVSVWSKLFGLSCSTKTTEKLIGLFDSDSSSIHAATMAGDLQKIKELIKDDPGLVFSRDACGWTPLHYAAGLGVKDVTEMLLANKADVNAKDEEGWTPLHRAVFSMRAYGIDDRCVKALIAAGSDEKAKNLNGKTPSMISPNDWGISLLPSILPQNAQSNFSISIRDKEDDLRLETEHKRMLERGRHAQLTTRPPDLPKPKLF